VEHRQTVLALTHLNPPAMRSDPSCKPFHKLQELFKIQKYTKFL
jgi:hypothetical protein